MCPGGGPVGEGSAGPAVTPPPPQVLFNVAAVQSQLGLWVKAACSLGAAISKGPEGARSDLDIALGQVQVRGRRGEPGS